MTQVVVQTNSVQIGTIEVPKNGSYIKTNGTQVGVFFLSGRAIIDMTEWNNYTDNAGALYANQAALITALRAALFIPIV